MRRFSLSKAAPLVAALGTLQGTQREWVGGKAANLSVMMKAGLPVPSGFCVTTAAFGAFLDSCPSHAEFWRILSPLRATQPDQVGEISRQLTAWLADAPIPLSVEEAVLAAWRERGEQRAYAVRSSATVEDAADHSFAGLFESLLNVQGQAALLAAIRHCWISLYSARSLVYHIKNGLPITHSAMAVVVQEMVAAESAGVLFTIDPISGDAERILIEASPGLGDRVVRGQIAPERIILGKSSLTVMQRTGAKRASSGATVLDNNTAQELARLSQRVEERLGGPLDIEWAFCHGTLHLLQARPAAGRRVVKTWAARQIWTNGNSGEAVPDPLTPMTYSVLMPFLQGLCDNFIRHLGFRIRVEELITPIAGRPYFNLNLGAALLRYLPGIKPEDVGSIFGGAHDVLIRKGLIRLQADDLPPLRYYPWQMICGMPPVVVAAVRFFFLKDPQAVHASRRSSEVPEVTTARNCSDEALLNAIRAALPTEQSGRDPALRFMGLGAFWLLLFFTLSKRWCGEEGPALAGRLTSGLGTLNPAEAGRDLWRLAEFAHSHAEVHKAVLEERLFPALEQRLLTLTEGRAFLERWHAVLARHGHHARGEVELMNPRWGETPEVVLALVRNYLEAGAGNITVPAVRLSELGEQRGALERECLRQLKQFWKRRLFCWSLNCARLGVAVKENVKSDLIKSIFHARLLLLELGGRLVERGRLHNRNDVFFLRVEELRPELLFDGNSDLFELTTARRREYDRNLKLNPPPVVFGSPEQLTWPTESSMTPVQHLDGLAVSPGIAVGRARVILKPDYSDRVLPGEILVAPSTDPAWSPYFLTASGIAIDLGGVLSHGSILAREYGLPAVTNLVCAVRAICTGDLVQVDGNKGRVLILERASRVNNDQQ